MANENGPERFTPQQKQDLEFIASSGNKGYAQARALLMQEYAEYNDYWLADIQNEIENRVTYEFNPDPVQAIDPFLEIHPNPASKKGYLVLTLPEGSSGEISIYDALGRLVFKRTVEVSNTIIDIDCSSWFAGQYRCQLVLDDKIVSSKQWIVVN